MKFQALLHLLKGFLLCIKLLHIKRRVFGRYVELLNEETLLFREIWEKIIKILVSNLLIE